MQPQQRSAHQRASTQLPRTPRAPPARAGLALKMEQELALDIALELEIEPAWQGRQRTIGTLLSSLRISWHSSKPSILGMNTSEITISAHGKPWSRLEHAPRH